MIGRPAVISSGTRGMKKRQEKYLMDEENRNSSEHVDLPPIDLCDIELLDAAEITKILKFRRIPYALWGMGSLILLIALYLLYHLTIGRYTGRMFKSFDEGLWWQYVLVFLFLILSFVFLYTGKVESLIFNKKENILQKSKSNILCRSDSRVFNLRDIVSIRILKKGHEGINVYTIHYKLVILFTDGTHVEILESSNKDKAKSQLFTIMTFLYGKCSDRDLIIIDDSSSLTPPSQLFHIFGIKFPLAQKVRRTQVQKMYNYIS